MTKAALRKKYKSILPELSERQRRLVLAADARALEYGGVSKVHQCSGVARSTIHQGLRELENTNHLPPSRSRKPGGGRKKVEEKYPDINKKLDKLIEPSTRGDPESPLRWTCKSTYKLAETLTIKGYQICSETVGKLLKKDKYSLQGNRKTKEGGEHKDRNAQFHYISNLAKRFLKLGLPVISVDTKKKELVGDYKNKGKEWKKQGKPDNVKVYDFIDKKLGKAVPYGIYDIGKNSGYVNVGISRDTAKFSVASIEKYWDKIGIKQYPKAKKIMITADCGGSNGSRVKLWKKELQRLANKTNLEIMVCHFPPGTSKWNKIEHRMFSHISMNWRGKPLRTLQIIISLIGSTTTKTGLKIHADLDENEYKTGIKVSDQEMKEINFCRHDFCGQWNYTIKPNL